MRSLTSEERAILETAHRHEFGKRHADRIKTILLLDKGYSYVEIASILLLNEKTCRTYYQEYERLGLEGLLEDQHQGGQCKLNKEQLEELKAHLIEITYYTAQEVIVYVRQQYGIEYSVSAMVNVLHRLGFSYKQLKKIPGKADAEKQKAFIEAYEGLKKSKDPTDPIYFVDGVHPQHNVIASWAWVLKGKDEEIRTNTGRKRVNFNGAYNVEAQELVIREDFTINSQSTIALFKQLEAKHPQSGKIYAISDNAKYYRAKIVKEYLETSRVKLIYLPSYSPNLNLIERLWKFFHKKVRRKYYEAYEDFKKACLDFFQNLDQHKPELASLITENFQIIGST